MIAQNCFCCIYSLVILLSHVLFPFLDLDLTFKLFEKKMILVRISALPTPLPNKSFQALPKQIDRSIWNSKGLTELFLKFGTVKALQNFP